MINFDKIIDRVKELKGLDTVLDVAELLGISSPDLYGRKKRGTLTPLIINWGINENINLHWLLTGEGDPYIYKVGGALDDDPEIASLLDMTRAVLKSDTDYSDSLAANVRSFFRALKSEKRISNIESELTTIKEKQARWEKAYSDKVPSDVEAPAVKKAT